MNLTQSYVCGNAHSPLLYETIGACFDRIANAFPEREALVVKHQNIRWNYSEYQHEVDRLALGLLKLGIGKGDRVGIWAPNCYEWCLTQFATSKIGAILVCVNPAYRLYELEYALNKVECRALIVAEKFKSSDYLNMLTTLAPELNHYPPGQLQCEKLPHLEIVIRMGKEITSGMFNFPDVCEMASSINASLLREVSSQLQPDDPINIQFTSGTTGSPKGATLSHFNILNNGHQVAEGMNFSEHDRLCIPVPLYHCFGMVLGNLVCVSHGAAAIFPSAAFDPKDTLRTISEEKCTALHGVPTMFIAELEHPDFNTFDLSSLRTGIMAGAPCPIDVMKQVIADMHIEEVTIMYGQTETSPANHMTGINDPIEKRVSTVGRVAPHLETKLIDQNGHVVPIGEKGELCCRGYVVMQGYWADKIKTDETIDQANWLRSGDLAIMDCEGYVQIVGRLKDMIIRGGENVYPREVEEFLYSHPDITEVQVFGIPHEKYGEVVCAWIQLKEQKTLSQEDVIAYCKEHITHFKIPQHIRFVDEFPMTVTGKIKKIEMRDVMINQK